MTEISLPNQTIVITGASSGAGRAACLPIFKAQKSGILINNISVGGFLPVPYGSGYTASKFGLRGFSEAFRF